MNTSTGPGNATPRRSIFSRMTLVAFLAGAALAGSIAAVAAATGMGGFHHGMMSGPYSAADVSAHVDHVLKHLYVEIDATDAQKAQITPLVQQAVNDLLPMHMQLQAAHEQAVQALMQDTVDRTALEAARSRTALRISSVERTGTQSTPWGTCRSVGPLTRTTRAPRRAAASASA
jgi:Spy/CpxP family protein refolding chaperone